MKNYLTSKKGLLVTTETAVTEGSIDEEDKMALVSIEEDKMAFVSIEDDKMALVSTREMVIRGMVTPMLIKEVVPEVERVKMKIVFLLVDWTMNVLIKI